LIEEALQILAVAFGFFVVGMEQIAGFLFLFVREAPGQ